MPPSADPSQNDSSVEGTTETTPLLLAPESVAPGEENGHAMPTAANGKPKSNAAFPETSTEAQHTTEPEEKPMPYVQILLLCYASLAEPIAYFSIFPFINEMIAVNGGLPDSDVGFWSGAIESLFSLVQMVLMIFYGRLADRLGRKPILVFSLAGVSVATALFGLSRTLWQMIFFRCLAGVFAGTVVTIRTMISENTTKASQGRAFSWYMFTRNMGIFIGPLVGGGFANPAKLYPGTFGHIQFFIDYPYALATFFAGAVVFSSTLTSLFLLKETLVRKTDVSSQLKPPMSTWQVLKSPGVTMVLYILAHVLLLSLGYTTVCTVFLYEPVPLGGVGFSPQYISYFIAVAGASQALWMLVAFPPLQKKLGTGTLMRACCVAWPFMMATYPVYNELLRHGFKTTFWVTAPIGLVLGSGVSMGFACVQLFINDISPSSTVLGTINALALTVSSAIRAIAPVLFTSIYAIGVKSQWADGHLVWVLFVVLAAGLNLAMWFLPEAAEGRPEEQKGKGNDVVVGGEEEDEDGDA